MDKLPLDEFLLEQLNKYLDGKQKYLSINFSLSMNLSFVRVFVKPVDRIVITDIDFIDPDKAVPMFTTALDLIKQREEFEILVATGYSAKSGNTTKLSGVFDNWEYQFCSSKEEHWYWWNRVSSKFDTTV